MSTNRFKKYLPLYNLAKNIHQIGLDQYDSDFYNLLKYLNLLTITVYTSGNIMTLFTDICCWYQAMEMFLTAFCGIIIGMMVFAFKTDNVKFHYWITVAMCIRILAGLWQVPEAPESPLAIHLIYCFSTFFMIDGYCFFLVNISHNLKMLIPIIIEIMCCIFLMQAIFTRVILP